MEERQDRTGQGERQRGIEGAPVSITEFLLARIAEDEAAAQEEDDDYADTTLLPTYDSEHQANWNTSRVLAECEAKRELVDAWHDEHGGGHVLRTLASVYSDHPDYQQKWAV